MIAQRGLKRNKHIAKLLTQWMASYGIPAIHQVTAILHPPMNRFGIAQNIPKNNPKSPDNIQ
jgi:hypothetical protein